MTMKIFLLRHGESEANIADRINDDPARIVNLTEHGKAQAGAAAEKLRAVPFTHVYVSEFPRARQTAGILLRNRTCSLTIDVRLNERCSGMDGLPVQAFNDLVRPDQLRIKPERGESFLEQMERLRSFMNEIAARHPDGIILAVSHENPILAVLALTGGDAEKSVRGSISNCAWVELEYVFIPFG